jgi:energy-coupling factor transporter transmembrane protein EcfT
MKKYIIWIAIILGLATLVFGVWAKILHKEYSSAAITVALIFEILIVIILMLIFIMWLNKRIK